MGKLIFFALIIAVGAFFLSPAWRAQVKKRRNRAAEAAEDAVVKRLDDYKKRPDDDA